MEILIKGEKRGLLWGLSAIDKFCGLVDLELEQALNLIFQDTVGSPQQAMKQTIALSKFTLCAAESYAKVNNFAFGNATYEDVLATFDAEGAPTIQAILEDFLQSKLLGQNVSDFLGVSVKSTDGGKKKEASPSEK